jgi:carboxylesterase type B
MVVTEPIASTTAGFVRGRRVDGAEEYLGIPFAIAERFAPPRPAPAWEGTRDALAAGPSAPQPGSVYVHGELPDADERGCRTVRDRSSSGCTVGASRWATAPPGCTGATGSPLPPMPSS